jgi:uncharacterized membrane protein
MSMLRPPHLTFINLLAKLFKWSQISLSRGFGGWRIIVFRPTRFSMFIVILAVALLSYTAVSAEEVSVASHTVDMFIGYNKVFVDSSIILKSKQTANISIELPYDARQITDNADSVASPNSLEDNILTFHLKDGEKIDYSYITSEFIDGDSFVVSFSAPFNISLLRMTLSLPEKAVLDKPIRRGSTTGSSIYPAPKRMETDGQEITAVWEFKDVKKGDEIALYAKYKKPLRYLVPLLLIVSGIFIFILGTAYVLSRKSSAKSNKASVRINDSKPHKGIEQHLKEDEEQVINVLKLKEGSCEQGTLRIATGFSKAKLSGLLKELEERKVIIKEKRGKKNRVFLKG